MATITATTTRPSAGARLSVIAVFLTGSAMILAVSTADVTVAATATFKMDAVFMSLNCVA